MHNNDAMTFVLLLMHELGDQEGTRSEHPRGLTWQASSDTTMASYHIQNPSWAFPLIYSKAARQNVGQKARYGWAASSRCPVV